MSKPTRFQILLLLVLLSQPLPSRAQYLQPFDLKIGEETVVAEGATVKFMSLAEDSRCPSGLWCLTSGQATVELALIHPGGVERLILSTQPNDRRAVTAAGYHIQFTTLLPDPPPTRPDPSAYHLHITITKLGG